MAGIRPFDSLFGLALWQRELGRELTEAELETLYQPGGEAHLITRFAAGVQPVRIVQPNIPEVSEHQLPSANPWTPEAIHASERHYRVDIENDRYDVYGFWFTDHGRFAAFYGTSRAAGAPPHVRSQPLSPLRLALLSTVIEQRAAAILAQQAFLDVIAAIEDDELRIGQLAVLMEEGEGIVEIGIDPTADSGDALIEFWGLAGLGTYRAIWHMNDDDRLVDSVEIVGEHGYILNPEIPLHRVVIELCRLYIG